MKKSSALLIAAALMLTSCGTIAQMADSDNGQQFQDGIYSNTPAFRTKVEKADSKTETQALIEKTKESPIYLFGDKKDTVMIPQDMSATIRYDQKLGSTVVTVGENPYDWRYDLENNYGYWYGPYSIGSSCYWSRHYSPWYSWNFAPWRYHGWYDPWYYGANWGWYDPWYYGGYWGGWYDPWYYGGYWGWYDSWYHPHHGWYDPYWGHHHHHHHGPGYYPDYHKDVWYGSRHQTGSERVFGSTSSIRGGIGSRSTGSRHESTGRSTASVTRTPSSGRSAVSRTTVARTTPTTRTDRVSARPAGSVTKPATGTVNRGTSSSSRPIGAAGRTPSSVSSQSNHRRPAGVTTNRGSGSSYSGSTPSSVNRGSGTTSRSSSYGGSSSYGRSSSSSVSRSSSSYGGGSSSRGSSGGGYSGGGGSRSGGSSGGRR